MAFGSQTDDRKFSLPGWRIEQKFSKGVLIGNWSEDRLKFQKDPSHMKNGTTNKRDYVYFQESKPDVTVRRSCLLRGDGLGPEHLFTHHGHNFSSNLITWYDENFNKRERAGLQKFPESRHWDGSRMQWWPEKNDFPLQGKPTNYGLLQQKRDNWKRDEEMQNKGVYNTTYRTSFVEQGQDALVRRHYAPPIKQSTNMHSVNKITRDWNLRNMKIMQNPERTNFPSIKVTST